MTKNENKVREPLFHIVKRPAIETWRSWLIRGIAIVAAILVSAVVVVVLTKENPVEVFFGFIKGNFGSARKIWKMVQDLAMLLIIAIAVTPAFKMKFWNLGAEGQVLAGGLAAIVCMRYIADSIPNFLLLIIMFIAALAGGMIWGIIPALFKAKWNTNESLFTLMMNYIAMQLVSFAIMVWVPNGSSVMGVVNQNTGAGWLPSLFGQKYLFNIIVVVLCTAVMYVYLKYSKHGYEISVVGESENTAKYIGINVKKVIIRTMLFSGALCGLAGFLLVAGTDHSITTNLAGGNGFTAIIVSWLAKFNPLIMCATSFLIVFLGNGASQIAMQFGLNESVADIISGIIIFFIIGCEFFINYRIVRTHKEG